MKRILKDLEEAIEKLRRVKEALQEPEREEETSGDFDLEKISEIILAIANRERIKILKELFSEGRYFTELLEATRLTNSSLYFHLKVLQEANLIRQEYQRGKYLLTNLGNSVLEGLRCMYEKCRRWIE